MLERKLEGLTDDNASLQEKVYLLEAQNNDKTEQLCILRNIVEQIQVALFQQESAGSVKQPVCKNTAVVNQ